MRSWEVRVNPDAPLHPDAIKVHGIKPADLKAAPRFPEVADALLAFLDEDLLVAHAYENEMDFLNYEFARCGRAAWGADTFPADRFICTKEMSHAAFPGASGSLDRHGRDQSQQAHKEHIEIPAFLRKHG